jgi:hypothetical protein
MKIRWPLYAFMIPLDTYRSYRLLYEAQGGRRTPPAWRIVSVWAKREEGSRYRLGGRPTGCANQDHRHGIIIRAITSRMWRFYE